jgi:serine protease Do
MKKTLLVALVSFILGIFLAGLVFVYIPEKNQKKEPDIFQGEPSPLASSLYASPSPQEKPDLDFASIADKVGPAVVQIISEKVEKRRVVSFGDEWPGDFWDRFFGIPQEREREYRSEARGAGFFISSDGYILTNNHLVENAEKVTSFSLQDKEYMAKVVGTDPLTDLALLKVDDKNLPFVELADSSQLRVGEWVLAIGNPWGLEHTVTAGIVSSKGRQLGISDIPYQDYIQTDAAINPGNSGGPLVNMKGEVVGINTLIFTPSGGNIGIGFAIPSNIAKKVVKQLKEKGRVVRGYLGVTTSSITEDHLKAFNLKSKKGALINTVAAGTPADKAGLKPYDVIVELNRQPVENNHDLAFKIADIEPGTTVEIKIIRDGKEKVLSAKLVELESGEKEETAARSVKDLGFEFTTMTARLARRLGYQTEQGVIVTEVRRYSEAEKKGLQRGDVIIEANRIRIENENGLQEIIDKLKSGDVLLLLVRRETEGGAEERIVTLRVP